MSVKVQDFKFQILCIYRFNEVLQCSVDMQVIQIGEFMFPITFYETTHMCFKYKTVKKYA